MDNVNIGQKSKNNILIFNCSLPQINFLARRTTIGPEIELVNSFIRSQIKEFSKRKRDFAIFIEPQIENSFPDIVIAEFNKSAFKEWNHIRSTLGSTELKVYHHLIKAGRTYINSIERLLGIEAKRLDKILSKLEKSGLIIKYSKTVKPHTAKKALGVKKLISIEAKIGNFSKAHSQAQANQWFASESYILTDSNMIKNSTRMISEESGVGIFSVNNQKVYKLTSSKEQNYPACFSSILFNEWIGRKLNMKEENTIDKN
jgi:DNA-binding HxlR family transcriptional regulator